MSTVPAWSAAPAASMKRRAAALPGAAGDHAEPGLPWVDDFAQALRHERHRAERTGAALSLLLLRVGPAQATAAEYAGDAAASSCALPAPSSPCADLAGYLIDILHGTKRRTDILGLLGGDTIALLCPDTGEAGCTTLLARILRLAAGLPCSSVMATYPDDLFDNLADGRSAAPALQLFMNCDERRGRRDGHACKRALDIVGALVALCLLGPFMLLVACAVAASSPGPVIFRQARLGRGGRAFTFYKFRSMVHDADDGVHRHFVATLIRQRASVQAAQASGAGAPSAAPYKLAADDRVTPLGRWMRRTSVDELPQLFNVLKGDMSLVGPRPAIAYETALYQPWHLARLLSVRPGMTGLWQVEGRSRVSFDDMVRMDLRYIRDCSLALDLAILLRTPLVVVRGHGAV